MDRRLQARTTAAGTASAPTPGPARPRLRLRGEFLTAAHLIIVWPERRPGAAAHAAAGDVGRNPRVDVYEPAFVACSYYQWDAAGNPVHAVRTDIAENVYRKT